MGKHTLQITFLLADLGQPVMPTTHLLFICRAKEKLSLKDWAPLEGGEGGERGRGGKRERGGGERGGGGEGRVGE